MKRILAALPLVAVMAAMAPAFATGKTMIHNNSGLPIDELSAAAPGTKDWGKNLLEGVPEGAFDTGKSIEVDGLVDGTYDLRISAPDEGLLCYMSNVTVKDGTVDLTTELGKACK